VISFRFQTQRSERNVATDSNTARRFLIPARIKKFGGAL
jgi:hypothetical protein